MSDKERQEKNARTLGLLRQIYALADEAENVADDAVIAEGDPTLSGLADLFAQTLDLLPALSVDMQKLLKSSWVENCNGKQADELFRGPTGDGLEGIGSGYPEHRRLPLALKNLLEREQLGDVRASRQIQPQAPSSLHSQQRADETKRRWAANNSQHIRTAGRIE